MDIPTLFTRQNTSGCSCLKAHFSNLHNVVSANTLGLLFSPLGNEGYSDPWIVKLSLKKKKERKYVGPRACCITPKQ
jgi:hypothetical protein